MTTRAGNPATRTQATAGRGYVLAAWVKAIGRALELLMQRLQCAEPSQDEVAEHLCMSARTPHHSVSEIPYLLGFSCGSSFTRAIRRWTGQAPSTWRAGAAAP
jgi:AraC-like DNA-binding protein